MKTLKDNCLKAATLNPALQLFVMQELGQIRSEGDLIGTIDTLLNVVRSNSKPSTK